jgi:hypothetical protein
MPLACTGGFQRPVVSRFVCKTLIEFDGSQLYSKDTGDVLGRRIKDSLSQSFSDPLPTDVKSQYLK